MIYIEQETMDRAAENANKALAAYKALVNAAPAVRREAWEAYKRAASDYRTFVRANYNL